MQNGGLGRIVVLNGAPRSGKSSIARAIQQMYPGVWMNLGVDAWVREVTPPSLRPGIGLRPGDERPELTALIPTMYAGLYETVAAHSRLGMNVVVDVGHHHERTLVDCARRLEGLPAWLVGVRCPIEVIMERRNAGEPGREGAYARGTPQDPVPAPVQRWQEAVHIPGVYDAEVDTSELSPEECSEAIRDRMEAEAPPSAFRELASRAR